MKFGTVNHYGVVITLTQQAYAENYGSGVAYFAHGVGPDGREYRVAWSTTPAWDAIQAAYRADPNGAHGGEDESEACDWATPAEVIELTP